MSATEVDCMVVWMDRCNGGRLYTAQVRTARSLFLPPLHKSNLTGQLFGSFSSPPINIVWTGCLPAPRLPFQSSREPRFPPPHLVVFVGHRGDGECSAKEECHERLCIVEVRPRVDVREHVSCFDSEDHVGKEANERPHGKVLEGDVHERRARVDKPVGQEGGHTEEQNVVRQVVPLLVDFTGEGHEPLGAKTEHEVTEEVGANDVAYAAAHSPQDIYEHNGEGHRIHRPRQDVEEDRAWDHEGLQEHVDRDDGEYHLSRVVLLVQVQRLFERAQLLKVFGELELEVLKVPLRRAAQGGLVCEPLEAREAAQRQRRHSQHDEEKHRQACGGLEEGY
mmetsp:Transcript_11582/g.36665  ORF Transcript_11582/g.36665 Transcript_11582/m.36665 type:complete len:336 (-) Transcript_11582:85-1092(-)